MGAGRWSVIVASAAVIGVAVPAAVGLVRERAQDGASESRSREHRRSARKEQLLKEYDLSNALIDVDKLLAPGPPKDGIPALTDPDRDAIEEVEYLKGEDRVVEVVVNGQAVAYPLAILNWHEIANDTVGGVPVAVTYCPLCDSASVFKRTLHDDDGTDRVLEFGVSGFLYNSNVMMYERHNNGLWSQVAMRAVTGPDAGRTLEYLPVRVVSWREFTLHHPRGEVLTTATGAERPYTMNPYAEYFADPHRVFHEFNYDDRLGPKELGLGIMAGSKTYFVVAARIGDAPYTVKTDAGPVVVRFVDGGMRVENAPEDVRTIQTFYHSWDAFHPGTAIVPGDAEHEE